MIEGSIEASLTLRVADRRVGESVFDVPIPGVCLADGSVVFGSDVAERLASAMSLAVATFVSEVSVED